MTENKMFKIAMHCLAVQAEQEVCEECDIYGNCHTDCKDVAVVAIKALEEIQQYRAIGDVEECREAVEKLTKAEKALNTILSGNYNDECNFCVHNDNPMANCNFILDDGSWCVNNAKWNGKIIDTENLEGMEDEGKAI